MRSDIEIAQACEMKHIKDIAAVAGVDEDYLEYYGKYKAKIDLKLLADREGRPDGKLVLVTAINPTPAGEGKTTTTVGLPTVCAGWARTPWWLCGSPPWVRCSG